MINTSQFRICDVHRLIDYDCAERMCTYCPMCSAWICQECSSNWPRRIKAAIKRRLEPGYTGQTDYPEMIEKQLKGELQNVNGAGSSN